MKTLWLVFIIIAIAAKQSGIAQESKIDGESLETLKTQLRDKDWHVRYAAVEAIGKMGSKAASATPILAELLTDDEWSIRIESARALGNIGPDAKQAVPALAKLLEDNQKTMTRYFAAEALGKIGEEAQQAIPNLKKLLVDKRVEVRWAAARALGKMGIEKVPDLPKLEDPVLRFEVAESLSHLSSKDKAAAVSIFIGLLEDKTAIGGRLSYIHRLGELGSDASPAIPVLTRLLREKKSIIPISNALARIGPDGTRAAMPILVELLRDSDESVKSDAAKSINDLREITEKNKAKKDENGTSQISKEKRSEKTNSSEN